MIRVVHPGSRIRMLTFYPSRIPGPGVKKAEFHNDGLLLQLVFKFKKKKFWPKPDPKLTKGRIRIRYRIRNKSFGSATLVKILKFFDEDPGWRQFGSGIRNGKKSDPG
jgi:hypothetical protein